VALAKQADVPQPDHYVTVFAGQDLDATTRAREYLAGIPPSSPFMALVQDGDPVFVLERRHIEGRSASAIASDLVQAYQSLAENGAAGEDAPARPEVEQQSDTDDSLPSTFRSIL
jgi:putative YphP/YqiW family bacilliredoxin